jgi:hypothetical protein
LKPTKPKAIELLEAHRLELIELGAALSVVSFWADM